MSSIFVDGRIRASLAVGTGEEPVGRMNSAGSRESVEGLNHWSRVGLRDVIASWLLPRQECRNAARASDDLQALYRTAKADQPDWVDRDLHKRVVMTRAGCDSMAAEAILKCAEECFAEWPATRELTLCDTAQDLSVTEFLASRVGESGIHSNFARLVTSHIPHDFFISRAKA